MRVTKKQISDFTQSDACKTMIYRKVSNFVTRHYVERVVRELTSPKLLKLLGSWDAVIAHARMCVVLMQRRGMLPSTERRKRRAA